MPLSEQEDWPKERLLRTRDVVRESKLLQKRMDWADSEECPNKKATCKVKVTQLMTILFDKATASVL